MPFISLGQNAKHIYIHIHTHTTLSTFWIHSSSTYNYEQFIGFFFKKKNWNLDMILHKLVHMYVEFHIILIIRKYVAKLNEKLYIDTQFCSSCLQNL